FCELTTGRREDLLRYFDDEFTGPCGNCDTCLEPPRTWDATTAARKALSCVHRTGQRFGVQHLVDVLLGNATERVGRWGHDRLSTYGIGTELDSAGWRNLFRQLIARGLLAVDLEGHGGLRLTEASRPVLRGECELALRERPRARPRTARTARGAGRTVFAEDTDRALWEALRRRRQELAQAQGVPAYVIFHDATLREMVERRPASAVDLAGISGIGARKLAAYGGAFLETIAAHRTAPGTDGNDPGAVPV
ncbi:MAG TPA: ATP-dependent DNA helicase RecQ, partial [Chromatiales bacterium]|nr:ATP-dependent DNA helicase RecQ [Chromatiales bacterium]